MSTINEFENAIGPVIIKEIKESYITVGGEDFLFSEIYNAVDWLIENGKYWETKNAYAVDTFDDNVYFDSDLYTVCNKFASVGILKRDSYSQANFYLWDEKTNEKLKKLYENFKEQKVIADEIKKKSVENNIWSYLNS